MNILEWVIAHSEPLTDAQLHMTHWHHGNGTLIGVGRPVGSSVIYPLVKRGHKAPMDVIDRAGYEQTAAPMSGRCPL